MKNSDKTNAMRVLDRKKIPYVSHTTDWYLEDIQALTALENMERKNLN